MCKKKYTEVNEPSTEIDTCLTTDDLDSLKTGLDTARQSYQEEIQRFYNLEKKAEYPLKFFSFSLTILAFLGIANIDYFKGFEGKQSVIVYMSVFLLLLVIIIALVCYYHVTRVWWIKIPTIDKENFHGIVNQGDNKRLIRLLIFRYSSAELAYKETNRRKAKYLTGLDICVIVYLCILLLIPLALIIVH